MSTEKRAAKIRTVTDVRIVCDIPYHITRTAKYAADRRREKGENWTIAYHDELAKESQRWISEFEDFIRDHRSQDPVALSVEKVEKDLCSACGDEWESYEPEDEPGVTRCACCGALVESDVAADLNRAAGEGAE